VKAIAVTDRRHCCRPLLTQLELICAAGADAVVLREKDLSPEKFEELAAAVLPICRRHGTELCLNTFASAAVRLGIGSVLLPAPLFRSQPRPPVARVGVSVHSRAEGEEYIARGVDFLVYGNVFPTTCKPGLPGRGFDELRQLCLDNEVPVYAIGGITPENVQVVRDQGADGVCFMSGLMLAEDPADVIAAVRKVRD